MTKHIEWYGINFHSVLRYVCGENHSLFFRTCSKSFLNIHKLNEKRKRASKLGPNVVSLANPQLKLILNNRFCLNTKVKTMLRNLSTVSVQLLRSLHWQWRCEKNPENAELLLSSNLLNMEVLANSAQNHKIIEGNWLTMKSSQVLHAKCVFSQDHCVKTIELPLWSESHNVNIGTIAKLYNNSVPTYIKIYRLVIGIKDALTKYLIQQKRR